MWGLNFRVWFAFLLASVRLSPLRPKYPRQLESCGQSSLQSLALGCFQFGRVPHWRMRAVCALVLAGCVSVMYSGGQLLGAHMQILPMQAARLVWVRLWAAEHFDDERKCRGGGPCVNVSVLQNSWLYVFNAVDSWTGLHMRKTCYSAFQMLTLKSIGITLTHLNGFLFSVFVRWRSTSVLFLFAIYTQTETTQIESLIIIGSEAEKQAVKTEWTWLHKHNIWFDEFVCIFDTQRVLISWSSLIPTHPHCVSSGKHLLVCANTRGSVCSYFWRICLVYHYSHPPKTNNSRWQPFFHHSFLYF